MSENTLFEAVANIILQSISVWEDMHLYALTYSIEYHTFWELLDERLKSSVCRVRKRNREERLVPFTMSMPAHYRHLLTQDNFARIKDQHWKKQLKTITTDPKFRAVMTKLNFKLESRHRGAYSYYEHHVAVSEGMRTRF
jgi:hypothetical protein